MRMLLAIDQSKDSKAAIQLLQKLKWPAGSTLIMLHVMTLDDEMTAASSSRSDKKKLADSGKPPLPVHSELHRLEKQFASETLQVQSMVVNGVPGQEILSVIQKKKIDMAIIGSRGLSRISGLLLGSVSEWVLNDASCSVLIGRPTARKAKSWSSLNILLATDGSRDAWKAVDVLKQYARVFSIGIPRAYIWQGLSFYLGGEQKKAQRAMKDSIAIARRMGMPYEEALALWELGRLDSSSEGELIGLIEYLLVVINEVFESGTFVFV